MQGYVHLSFRPAYGHASFVFTNYIPYSQSERVQLHTDRHTNFQYLLLQMYIHNMYIQVYFCLYAHMCVQLSIY